MKIGSVESLWRYPVKSMRGEELQHSFIGFSGIFGDRVYAFRSSAAIKAFPYLTGREQEAMLQYRPVYRHPDRMASPGNLAEAEALGSGVTPVYPDSADLALDVETPAGERLSIDDPRVIRMLLEGVREAHELTLLRSDRAMTDCRPVSIFSIQTARQLGEEAGCAVDKRRFRANIYVDLDSGKGFGEDELVGRTLAIGEKTRVIVMDRDSRCKMVTLDPDTSQQSPEIMRQLARNHETKAGIYAVVLVEGTVRPGDEIRLVN